MTFELEKLFVQFINESKPLIDLRSVCLIASAPIVLLAPSGWGKTTVFRALSGWYDGDESQVHVCRRWKLSTFTDVDFIGTHASLLPWRRVLDNLITLSGCENVSTIIDALLSVGLGEDVVTKWPYQLSVGMYKRVELVAALLRPRKILLLDEFFSSLDADAQLKCGEQVCLRRGNFITLISTHSPETLPFTSALSIRLVRDQTSTTITRVEAVT